MTLSRVSSVVAFAVGSLLIAFLLIATIPHVGFAQGDSWVGTWKLNVAKSKFVPGPPTKSDTIKITADGGWTGISDGVNAQGQPTHTEITAKFDGKDYPLKGATATNTTRTFKRIDDHSFEFTNKVNGKVTTTTRVVVSPDGKSQTVTTTGMNTQGQTINNVTVWEKQ